MSKINIGDVLAATYLAGVSSGAGRDITDWDEIMHRREAFIKSNPVCADAKEKLALIIKDAAPQKKFTSYNKAAVQDRAYEMAVKDYQDNIDKLMEAGEK